MGYYDIVSENDYNERVEEMLDSFKDDPLRQTHMEKLADAFFDNLKLDNCEYGAWGVDCKRPFGNSFVEGDIAKIIEEEMPESETEEYDDMIAYIGSLWRDLGYFLRWKWLLFRMGR